MSDFNWAIQKLKEGKKVRRKDWGNKELRGSLNGKTHICFEVIGNKFENLELLKC